MEGIDRPLFVGFDHGKEGNCPLLHPGLRPVIQRWNIIRYWVLDIRRSIPLKIEYHI